MFASHFTSDEIAAIAARCARTPTWRHWSLRAGPDRRDVIEISVEGRPPGTLKLTKTEPGRVAATGFDGWGLTVCDDIGVLLEILGRGASAIAMQRPAAGLRRPPAASA